MEEDEDKLKEFTDDSGKKLIRKDAIHTKYGIVIIKMVSGDRWHLEFPDYTKATISTIELINLIYFLKETDGNLNKSKQWVGIK